MSYSYMIAAQRAREIDKNENNRPTYKIIYVGVDGTNRGIEYSSRHNPKLICDLWGEKGAKAECIGTDDYGNTLYLLTDSKIKINPILVTVIDQNLDKNDYPTESDRE
jgi:hypothetical protein